MIVMDNWLDEDEKDIFFTDDIDPTLKDFDLENVNWDAAFKALELPPPTLFEDDLKIALSNSRGSSSGSTKTTKCKDGRLFHTTSPYSVLEVESSNSFSLAADNLPIDPKLQFAVKSIRSKRKPASSVKLEQLSSLISLLAIVHALHEIESSDSNSAEKHSRKRKRKNLACRSGDETDSQVSRICSHCGVTKTPQWREGPNGPKTLCNACGVRYRSGRLLPEYRPAASPSFIPSVHSNSHKKILEKRKKAEAMGICADMPHSPVSSVGLMSH